MQHIPHNLSENRKVKKERHSGIELLKIIAIILIVIHHVVQTLRGDYSFISYSDYVIDLRVATADLQKFILILFSHFGILGNSIFFVCSSWFLLRSSHYDKRKWFFMLFEVWFISILILSSTLIIRHGSISEKIIIRSFFPTTFANNWYLTCYLLFYPIHPFLNSIIYRMGKQALFRSSATLFVIYCCINFVNGRLFFPSHISLWITIYFVMAYIQLYLKDLTNSFKCNMILLFVGFIGFIATVVTTNILGLHISFLNDKVLHWKVDCNPFLIVVSIALFNLARKMSFKSWIINYLSSLSLLVYIIHENIILRNYYRPAMWDFVYRNYGYNKVVIWTFVLALIVFAFGLVSSIIYDKTIRQLVRKAGDNLYSFARIVYLKVETGMLKLH